MANSGPSLPNDDVFNDTDINLRSPPIPYRKVSAADKFQYEDRRQFYYPMQSNPKGLFVIVNNKTFDKAADKKPLPTRLGTDKDREAMKATFEALDFHVQCHEDVTSDELKELLLTVSKKDHSAYDAFGFCILTHGKHGLVTCSDCVDVPILNIVNAVKASACPSLAEKPKLFFFQACQGLEKNDNCCPRLVSPDGRPSLDDRVPDQADMLLCYCTFPGQLAYRDNDHGSPFIAILTDLIDKYGREMDILEILTLMIDGVSQQAMNNGSEEVSMVPAPQTTLRRTLFLDTRQPPQRFTSQSSKTSSEPPLAVEVLKSLLLRYTQTDAAERAPDVRMRVHSLTDSHESSMSALSLYSAGTPYTEPEYKINVSTSSGVTHAGTKANVYVILYGKNGRTQEIHLKPSSSQKTPFKEGSKDVFTVKHSQHLGDLYKIHVRHDDKGLGSAWHLEKIDVQDMRTFNTFSFHCGQWLSSRRGDKRTERDLTCTDILSSDRYGDSTLTEYKVIVKTSADITGAGTDANVFLILYGHSGSESAELHLRGPSQTNKKPFQKGQIDDFVFPQTRWLGPLKKLRVWHDNTGLAAAWHLESIQVEDPNLKKVFHFPCCKWLSNKEGEGRISRELVCSDEELNTWINTNTTTYKFSVVTSSKLRAGTDANVYVILFGTDGDSEQFHLRESESYRDPFEKGHTDIFIKRYVKRLGDLQSLKVWHDNSGRGPGWHLAYIQVEDLYTGSTFTFHCNRWLSMTDDDHQIVRVLSVTPASE